MKAILAMRRAAFFVWVCAAISTADVRLPAILADQMVLQRNTYVPIWGWADPGEKIAVNGSWPEAQEAQSTASTAGKWLTLIKTPNAGGPYILTIKGNNTIILNDILIGEVWICAGQSNMKLSLDGYWDDPIMKKSVETADFPMIREFFVPRVASALPEPDCQGQWQTCTPQTAGSFSAVAFYFGRELNQKLNIPIGLINASWGATSAEAWTSSETLMEFDAFRNAVQRLKASTISLFDDKTYNKIVDSWKQKISSIDAGTKAFWQKPDFNDSDWKSMKLPSPWTGTDLSKTDGIIWFRRQIKLPPSWTHTDLELHLGLIDDIDTVWINGIEVGTTLAWLKPRTYRIPASAIRAGLNTIAIRVIDPRRGEGGFTSKPEEMFIQQMDAHLKTRISVAGVWNYKFSHPTPIPDIPLSEPDKRVNQSVPVCLYNGMIHPLILFRIAGAIWYQGESNCYDPILYRKLFPAMITDWRNQWKQGDFPFYYVQIAPYDYGNNVYSQAIREAQLMALDKVPNVGMAVLMDIGEEKDIHPVNKLDVGKRLALWALANTYDQQNIVFSGPLYKGMKIERNKIRISFNYTNGGLVAKDGPLTDFMIAGEDHVFISAKAVIEGDTIVVSSPDIQNPVAVRYAWSNWARPNLFNEAGLPASSFRTDDWPLNETTQNASKNK
ncbi:MAG: hypothetical protein JXB18_04070 [Sedimentisphaerales bacterium]|nr:hypothetical protein [Sedimentisphaerales bacterium]